MSDQFLAALSSRGLSLQQKAKGVATGAGLGSFLNSLDQLCTHLLVCLSHDALDPHLSPIQDSLKTSLSVRV